MTRITGQQARELLERVEPVGNWDLLIRDGEAVPVVVDREQGYKVAESTDCNIAAMIVRAPDLAETVTWLYGRESDLEREHYTNWDPTDRADQWGVSAMKWKGNVLLGDNHSMQASELSPDEAVDLARALLAAAQEARNGQ